MHKFLKKILSLANFNNQGATLIEYVLIVSLLGVAIIGGFRLVGTKYTTLYNGITYQLNEVDKTSSEAINNGA